VVKNAHQACMPSGVFLNSVWFTVLKVVGFGCGQFSLCGIAERNAGVRWSCNSTLEIPGVAACLALLSQTESSLPDARFTMIDNEDFF
jgi:hypothetical protein